MRGLPVLHMHHLLGRLAAADPIALHGYHPQPRRKTETRALAGLDLGGQAAIDDQAGIADAAEELAVPGNHQEGVAVVTELVVVQTLLRYLVRLVERGRRCRTTRQQDGPQ